jgi:cation transporter-like permease
MAQDMENMESILRKSLKDVDRTQKWQVAALGIFFVFLLVHMYGFIVTVHGGGRSAAGPSERAIAMGILSVILTVGVCTFGITYFIARMTKRILKAIELYSKS